jgi:hypothetical protein
MGIKIKKRFSKWIIKDIETIEKIKVKKIKKIKSFNW